MKRMLITLVLLLVCAVSAQAIRPAYVGDGVNKGADGYDVRAYKVTGDGITNDRATIAAADTAANNADTVLIFPAAVGNYKISTDITLSSVCYFKQNGILSPDNGVVVTLSSTFIAGNYQIFDISSGGSFILTASTIKEINPKWFGVTGDGVTDDTTGIQAAIDLAELDFSSHPSGSSSGVIEIAPTVNFPPGVYLVTGLLVESNVVLNGAGPHRTILKTTSNRPVIDIAHIWDAEDGYYKKDANQYITNMTIIGDATSAEETPAKPDQCAIRVNCDRAFIDNVWINRMRGDGIIVSSGITSTVQNCVITECFNGTGIHTYSYVQRIPVTAAGNGGPADGDSVIGASSGATATVKHYWANTLAAAAGDIEIYGITGTFSKAENIQVVGDATTYVTTANVGANDIQNYYYYNNTSGWIFHNTVRVNKCGIKVDSTINTRVENNLIESNNTGYGALYAGAERPGIGVEVVASYYGSYVDGIWIYNNYFEGQVCDIKLTAAFALVANNSHYGKALDPGDYDTPQTVYATNIWTTGYRTRMLNEKFWSGFDDGLLRIDGPDNLIEGCIKGTGSTRSRIEYSDLAGTGEYMVEAIIIDPWRDFTVADSLAPRVHYGTGYDQLISFHRAPISAQNFQAVGGRYGFGDGWDANVITYAAAEPTTGTWVQGDVVYHSDPAADDVYSWECIESGTFTAIAETGDTTDTSDGVTDISGWTNLRIGVFVDITGVTGTFQVIDRDTVADTITLDGNADATLDDAAIANHDPVFDEVYLFTDTPTFTTVDTGQGANELYDMDQNVLTTSAPTFATVDTGQGANELYDMDQNVLTTSTPTFLTTTISPTAPTYIASLTDVEDDGGNCFGVFVSGNYLYVAGHGEGMYIYDITDPASSSLLVSIDNGGFYMDIAVVGNIAYVANAYSFIIHDISDRTTPTTLSTYAPPLDGRDVIISGNIAYFADGTNGLLIIDISDSANPSALGSIDDGGTYEGLDLYEDRLYVACGADGLRVYDVSDPTTPVLEDTDDQGSAWDVVCDGHYAYVAYDTVGIVSYTVSDRDGIAVSDTLATGGQANGLFLGGDVLYVANGTAGLTSVNISDPTNMTIIGGNDQGGDAHDVFVVGRSVYLASEGQAVDISTIEVLNSPTIETGVVKATSVNVERFLDVNGTVQISDGLTVQNETFVEELSIIGKTGHGIQSTTLGVGATTFAVLADYVKLTGDGEANALASITGGIAGQMLILEFQDGNITLTDTDAHTANTMDLTGTATNQVGADDMILILVSDGTSWYQAAPESGN